MNKLAIVLLAAMIAMQWGGDVVRAVSAYTQTVTGQFECEVEIADGMRSIEIHHCTLTDMEFSD